MNTYQKRLHAEGLTWEPAGYDGVSFKILSGEGADEPLVTLYRFDPGARLPAHRHKQASETAFVVAGNLIDGGRSYGPGSVLRGAPGEIHGPHDTLDGCTVLFVLSRKPDLALSPA